eukprot:760220-Hanusia_phi.AAC.3
MKEITSKLFQNSKIDVKNRNTSSLRWAIIVEFEMRPELVKTTTTNKENPFFTSHAVIGAEKV